MTEMSLYTFLSFSPLIHKKHRYSSPLRPTECQRVKTKSIIRDFGEHSIMNCYQLSKTVHYFTYHTLSYILNLLTK